MNNLTLVTILIVLSSATFLVTLSIKIIVRRMRAEMDEFLNVTKKLERAIGNVEGREQRGIEQRPKEDRERALSRAEGNLEGRAQLKNEQIEDSTQKIVEELKALAIEAHIKDKTASADKMLVEAAKGAAEKLIEAAKVAAEKLQTEVQKVSVVQDEGEAIRVVPIDPVKKEDENK